MTLLDTEQSYVESLRTLMQVRGHGWGAGGHVVRQGDIGSCHSTAVPSLWPSLLCGHPFLVAIPALWPSLPCGPAWDVESDPSVVSAWERGGDGWQRWGQQQIDPVAGPDPLSPRRERIPNLFLASPEPLLVHIPCWGTPTPPTPLMGWGIFRSHFFPSLIPSPQSSLAHISDGCEGVSERQWQWAP